MVMSHQEVLGMEPWSSERAASSPNHWAISPALHHIFKVLIKGKDLTKDIIYSCKSDLKKVTTHIFMIHINIS